TATIFISRNLNQDDFNKMFKAGETAFSAGMAVGAPGFRGKGGIVTTAWVPDYSAAGPHLLEVGYSNPTKVTQIRVHETMPTPVPGQVIVRGASGTVLTNIPFTSGVSARTRARSRSYSPIFEFSIPLTSEPVKTVRFEFPSVPPNALGIDAVELV